MAFILEIEGLDKLKASVRKSPEATLKELTNAIKTSVNIIRPIMRQEAPAKSGKLSRNIYARSGGLTGEVGPNLQVTPYAWYVHQGTGPYDIRPKLKKALYWEGAPGDHPWARVHHPGIKANPFVKRAFDRMKVPVQTIFHNTIKRIIGTMAG